jgi:tRNA (cmo5U34)-methyltransferase
MSISEVFNKTAKDYDRARRQLVPCFDEFYDAIIDRLTDPASILDLGCGTGLSSLFLADAFPQAQLELVDVSDAMLDQARDRLGENRFTYTISDFMELRPSRTFDAVISALAIHHLSHGDKKELFARIHGWIRPGGLFVNADQAAGPNADEDQRYRDDWIAQVRERGVLQVDLDAAFERMKEDRNAI